MANVINMGGSVANTQSLTVQSGSSQLVFTPRVGVDGFSPVIVNPVPLQTKSIIPSHQSQNITYDSGYNGLDKVTVGSVQDVIITDKKTFSTGTNQSIFLNTDVKVTSIVSVSLYYTGTSATSYGIVMLCYNASTNKIKVVQSFSDSSYAVSEVANGTIAYISINSAGAVVIENTGYNLFESDAPYECFAAVHIR